MDRVTVSRELLRQAIEALNEADNVLTSSMFAEAATALRAALEQPAVEQAEKLDPLTQLQVAYVMGLRDANSAPQPAPVQEQHPVAEVVWSQDTNCEFKFKMLVELACKEGIPVKLYAGPFESGGLYWHDTAKDKPTAPPPDRMAQLEAANTNLFEQGQKMHKRIQELELGCKIGAQEMVKAYEEIDNLKAQVSWQKPVAWCRLGLDGKIIAYFDGKPMIMTGHVGNQHHPTPLFTAQPRKAVKLSDSEILTALDVEYVSSAQNRELFLSDARTIEQAVWAKLGVSDD